MKRLSTRVAMITLAVTIIMLLLFSIFFLLGVTSGIRNWEERMDHELDGQVERFILDWIELHPDTGLYSIGFADIPERISGITGHLLILNANNEVVLSYDRRKERPEGEKGHIIWRILNLGSRDPRPLSEVTMHGEVVALFTINSVQFHTYQYSNLAIETMANLFLPFCGVALLLSLISGYYLSRFTTKSADRLSKKISKLVEGDQNIIFTEEPVTELNSISQSVRKLQKQLIGATLSQKQWIDDISHDLKTPISAIQIQLEGIQDGIFKPDDARIQNLLSELGHIKALVDKFMLLTYLSGPDTKINAEPIDIYKFLHSIIPLYQDLAEREDKFITAEIDEGIVVSDRELLTRIASNLLVNAVKYSPMGGEIKIAGSFNEDVFHIQVENKGHIPEVELPFIYNSLFRGEKSRSSPGSGMGLTIVKKLVELLNGEITIYNASDNEGEQTVIARVKLPPGTEV